MTPAVVILDAHEGSMTRYVFNGHGQAVKTHSAVAPEAWERPFHFAQEIVDRFRTHPPGDLYVGPPAPVPGGNNPSGAPAAGRSAPLISLAA